MASFLKNAFAGEKADVPIANKDSDFADFAEAPSPQPVGGASVGGAAPAVAPLPYTKWYNVHERHSISEFKAEGIILAFSCLVFFFHILGARANRTRAKKWIRAHAAPLTSEFALVGFGGVPNVSEDVKPDTLIKEKSLFEFATYATGRQNIAFMDIKITLTKKFNPFINFVETALAFFMDSFNMPSDYVEAFIYPFDGKEALTVPALPGAAELRAKDMKSTFDNFVWGIVNKDAMRKVRDERYDISLTFTKDNSKLPSWLTVMSESAEITDTLLTPELIDAIKSAGELFDYIIISDQPGDRPRTVEETTPRKRLLLKYRLPSDGNYEPLVPLFKSYVRLPDHLVKNAHFRPEVLKKVRSTREAMVVEIKKVADEEKAEERLAEKEKAKKAKRDAELAALDAKAQKRFLEKEKEKELRRSQRKQTVRG